MSRAGDRRGYEVGGLRFILWPERSDLRTLLPPGFEGFAAPPDAAPDFRVRLEEAEEMAADPISFFLPHRFELMESKDRYVFINRHDRVKRLGEIDPNAREARLLLPAGDISRMGEETSSAVAAGVGDFLKSCLQIFLLREGGTLLHACGVTGGGRGFLLMGPSGSGKSTAARKLKEEEGVCVLNDDLVALKTSDGGFTVGGTPWTGSKGGICCRGSAPLNAAFSLRRAAGSRVERLNRRDAVRELLANLPWMGEGEGLTHPTISAAAALAGAVPVYRLTFRPEDDLWELMKGYAE